MTPAKDDSQNGAKGETPVNWAMGVVKMLQGVGLDNLDMPDKKSNV